MPAPRTVVFDLGEVLVPSTEVLPPLAAALDVTEGEFDGAYWRPRRAYDLGGASDVYWTQVVTDLGRAADPGLLRSLDALDSAKWSTLPPLSVDLIDGLARDGVRLAVLSNAPAPLAAAVRAAPWSEAFAHLVFSAEVGLVKPDPAIYARADAGYGTAPADVVYFDDRPANVAAARAHGWDAQLWVDPPTALAVVAARLAG